GVDGARPHAVGHPEFMVDAAQMPALKRIEKAARAFHRLAHGADQKSSAPVAAAVIEDVDGAAGLWINDAIELSGCRVVVGQSAPPGNQQSSTHARRKRAELFWRRPAF